MFNVRLYGRLYVHAYIHRQCKVHCKRILRLLASYATPRVHKTECANFFQVYIANVGTFCATLVKGGGSACYKNRKQQVRLHRFYPAVVAYLCVCRRNFVAHNIPTKMRSKLDTANSRTAKKIRWKLTDTRYSITKYDARTHDNRRMSEKR